MLKRISAFSYKRLNIRHRVILIFVLVVILSLAVVEGVSHFVLLGDYEELEAEVMVRDVQRVSNALASDVENLDIILFDWSAWDDTYRFVQDGNQSYIDSNFVDETFASYPLNLVVALNSQGEIVYSKGYDLGLDREVPLPVDFLNYLNYKSTIKKHITEDSVVKGILLLDEGPLLLSSRPVITSDESGPIVGTLIMRRFLTDDRANELAEMTRTELEIWRLDASDLPSDYQAAVALISYDAPVVVQAMGRDGVAGYA